MVLESLINPFTAKKRPVEAFFAGIVFATVALFLSYWVFRDYASLIMVFLTTLVSVPLLYFTMKHEEHNDVSLNTETSMLKEHSKALTFLILLFVGFVVAFAFWYVVLPSEIVNTLFFSQAQTVLNINNQISGNAVSATIFMKILINNVRVLVFSVLFAFLYGVGAIFILTWNASVVATAMGNLIRSKLATLAAQSGAVGIGGYLSVVSVSFFRYAFHGIPEMLSYFVGGLAGGILSVAIIRKDFQGPQREKVLFDSAQLIVLALILLVISAFMEVYLTPVLFIR